MKRALQIALLALPVAATAQAPSSIAFGVGFMTFGTRLERLQGQPDASSFEYSNSAAVEIRYERGLSRRTGLAIAAIAAPFSGQRATFNGETSEGDVSVFDDVSVFGGEVALTFRFKPTAPVFLWGGLAFMHFTKYSDPRELGGGVNEPGATLGLGYDVRSSGKYNFRLQLGLHLMKPADGDTWRSDNGPIPTPNEATSLTQDWSFSVAIRRSKKE